MSESTPHPSHHVRSSDASTFDLICTRCGATDKVPGGLGKLAEVCAVLPADERAEFEKWALAEGEDATWLEMNGSRNFDDMAWRGWLGRAAREAARAPTDLHQQIMNLQIVGPSNEPYKLGFRDARHAAAELVAARDAARVSA